jgi:hypothetical protein
MSADQTEQARGEGSRRIRAVKEISEGAAFWLNSITPGGQIYVHDLVVVVKAPYESREYPGYFAQFKLKARMQDSGWPAMVLSLAGLGVRLKPDPNSQTSSWLEPYVEPKSSEI